MREFRGSHPYERVRLGVDIPNLLEITVILRSFTCHNSGQIVIFHAPGFP